MSSNIFCRFFQRCKKVDVESSESHQSLDIQRAKREALIHQTERLCASDRARTNAVLERLRFPVQQDNVPSPQPSTSPQPTLQLSAPRHRIRHVLPVPHTGTQLEEVHLGRGRRSSSKASTSSEDTLSSVDTHTPTELRAISCITTPVELSPIIPPPAAPRRRRASLLPVMSANVTGAVKDVAGGYRLQTAKDQMERIQKQWEHIYQDPVVRAPRPPAVPKRNPKTTTTVVPVPPPKPVEPIKKVTRRGTSVRPAKAVARDNKTAKPRTEDTKNKEELQPLSNPVESLSLSFKLLSSTDWMKKIEGLRILRALVQHHPDILKVKLHEVCLAVTEEVKSLYSSVACAAMDTLIYLYVYLQKDMDTQAERTGRALLLMIAQSAANVFIQQQANKALEALVQNCSPGRVLNALLNTGLSHLCAAVRASTAQQLRLMADKLGAARVLTGGNTFTQRFLFAISKMSVDAAAEVRPHGHAVLQELVLHKDFTKLWNKVVTEKDRHQLETVMRTMRKA